MMHAQLAIFPQESRVLEGIQIRVRNVRTGQFDLNMDTFGHGNF